MIATLLCVAVGLGVAVFGARMVAAENARLATQHCRRKGDAR